MAEDSDAVTDVILTDENVDVGDFSELNASIAGAENEFKLEKDYTYNQSTDGNFYDGINIEKDNFVIDGNGNTIDGKGLARIFNINANNVTLKNIKLINGHRDDNGGAVYFAKNGTVENSIFINNTVPWGKKEEQFMQ